MAVEMTLKEMTPAQMRVLKKFYAQRLDDELERLWNSGMLDQSKLDELRTEHLRTPYRG